MTDSRKKLGEKGEEIAIGFLKKNKYKILSKNYRCPFGEIDIIAQQGKVLSFIEVKTRSSEIFGAPQEAIHLQKQKKISRVALAFIQRYRLEDRAARFDVITIKLSPDGYTVDLIQNAFDLTL